MSSTQPIYCVTVSGQYYANINGLKTFQHYKEEFKLTSMDCALSIIKNTLLDARLRRTQEHYAGFRTYKIENVRTQGQAHTPSPAVLNLPIENMTVAQLNDFCLLRGFSIDPYKGELESVRAQVLKANRDYIVEDMKNTEAKRQLEADDALRALNDLPSESEGGLNSEDTPTPSDAVEAANHPNINVNVGASGGVVSGPDDSAPSAPLSSIDDL